MIAHDSVTTCYHLPRSYFHIGVCCTAFFIFADVGSTSAAYWNLDGSFVHPMRDAVIYASFWSCWSLPGAGLIAYYFRYRLFVSDCTIERVGLVFTRAIDSSEVNAVVWRGIWSDVVLRAGKKKLRIELDNL